MIAKRSDLRAPRHWVHHLSFPDEVAARQAGALVTSGGWELQTLEPAAEGSSWVVIAERQETVVDESAVVAARSFFEDVAASAPGGDDDGWEASV